ncbi:CaiB/BaiF CoA transferase family protein [Tepidicaulis sp. LMO-SS28]|uniref:CaiB/BaiF CoA transferase family protein n=1 Tax=Tepidicaulis sp. LMO-SS28 TaxID=3447455 RepID=UPI003EE3D745
MQNGLFDDLLVIDCASYIAGPAAGTIFADLGARVIKVEPPAAGDSYRLLRYLPGMPVSEIDYPWLLDNRSKESLALDLKHEKARPVFEDLIKKADVFITNFPGPIRERLHLREEDILALNDRIIYASLTPYGEEGPEKDRTGYDATAWWARSGLMHAVRPNPEAEPAMSVPGMGDHATAASLYGAIMTGLYKREKTGKGSAVSTSLLANGLWSNALYMQAVLCEADFSVRLMRGQRGALTELYPCKDGRWFMLAMLNQVREWPLLTECIGKPELQEDPRFDTAEKRQTNAPHLLAILEEAFRSADWADWQPRFLEYGLTVGPIAEPSDHVNCPQIKANNFLPEVENAAAIQDGLRTVDSPIRIHGEKRRAPAIAPAIGEHTRTILTGLLNYDAAKVDTLLAAGALGALEQGKAAE